MTVGVDVVDLRLDGTPHSVEPHEDISVFLGDDILVSFDLRPNVPTTWKVVLGDLVGPLRDLLLFVSTGRVCLTRFAGVVIDDRGYEHFFDLHFRGGDIFDRFETERSHRRELLFTRGDSPIEFADLIPAGSTFAVTTAAGVEEEVQDWALGTWQTGTASRSRTPSRMRSRIRAASAPR